MFVLIQRRHTWLVC